MQRRFRHILLFLIGAASWSVIPSQVDAQVPATVAPSDTIWEFRLADGTSILGQIVAVTPERLTVRTPGGLTADLERPLIRSMGLPSGTIRDGRLWANDPNRTRLLFGPTGRMLEAGEGYVGVFELFLPFVSFAVTDYLTVAGGTPIVPEGIGRVWYFAPKAGGSIGERTSIAGGVFGILETGNISDDFETLGVAYAVATHGTEDRALTAGVGFGFAGGDVESRPAFLLGGETRISPRIKLLTENYLITYRAFNFTGAEERTLAASLLSLGVRFIGERLSADAGVGAFIGDDENFCCLPLVNFVYNFGTAR